MLVIGARAVVTGALVVVIGTCVVVTGALVVVIGTRVVVTGVWLNKDFTTFNAELF